jgi:hypothetical protein
LDLLKTFCRQSRLKNKNFIQILVVLLILAALVKIVSYGRNRAMGQQKFIDSPDTDTDMDMDRDRDRHRHGRRKFPVAPLSCCYTVSSTYR